MNKQIHVNSRIAWSRLQGVPLTQRQKMVLDWFGWANRPMTDRQCKEGMGFDDMNQVRPRITELIKANALEEVSRVKDRTTGAGVRTVRVSAAILETNQADMFD